MKDKVLNVLKDSHLFLTGGAGVGKSYLTREIISEYKRASKHVVSLGSTGISAVSIGGQTCHSFFVFGIANSLEELVMADKKRRKKIKELNELLKSCDLLVIDEVSMISANLLEMIRYRLEKSSFSGRVIFVGDFFQLPPVIKRDSFNTNLFDDRVYAFESDAWEWFSPVCIELKEMKRTKDREFFEILSRIRMGRIDDEVLEYLDRLSTNHQVLKDEPTFLYGRNKEVYDSNVKKLHLHKAKEVNIEAEITLHDKKLHPNRVKSWINSLPVDENLTLKVGVPILFTSNKWGKFYNGERGLVRDITDECLIVQKSDKLVKVQKQEFDLVEYTIDKNGELKEESLATFSQYPVKLAYALTIHKSQGMSIDKLVCNVDHIFTPSQFYVAIGRAIEPKTLFLEYSYGSLKEHLKRVIKVSNSVKEFYKKLSV